jgi:two-component system, sporulation sensor kinase B
MLAEKLIFQILIVITPVLLYLILFENRKISSSPYLYGLLHGISAITCMLFSYQSFGHNWDLRYIPLIIAILYGGPIAGGVALLIFVSTRLMIGGDLLIYGVSSCLISVILPFLIVKKFYKFSPSKRILVTFLMAVWPLTITTTILVVTEVRGKVNILEYIDVILFGVFLMICIPLAAKLNELAIERIQLKDSIERSEKLNMLGELAASIAHEVRNPLTVVKGFLQLMKQSEKGKEYEYLSLILSELGRAESIINDYLNFAKPQFNKMEAVPLVEVIKEVIFLLEPLASKQGIILKCEDDGTQPFIYTDRNQLKQALINFIKNAIEATNTNGFVNIHIASSDQQIRLVITDTGKGMDKEQLSRIGTLFYTTKDKGTGLGTTVSMKIIETMNGKVSYKSTPGIGTEVIMTLPMLKKEFETVIA